MSRRAWTGAAIVLLAGCGGSQPRPLPPAAAPSQSPAATAPTSTATTPAKAPRPKPATAGGGTRPAPAAAGKSTAATTPLPPRAGGSKRRAGANQGAGGPPASGATAVALILHGGENADIKACGSEHHYRTYAVGAKVAFSGSVRPIPSGRWKVKLKVKVCSGGSFAEFAKLDAVRDKHSGTFNGSFQAPAAGLYGARAVLYLAGSEAAKSVKRHFATR